MAQTVALFKASPPDTYRHLVKYIQFGEYLGGPYIDLRLYWQSSPPRPGTEIGPENEPIREMDELGQNCGPRAGEPWPKPIELFFNDPKRYFKLCGRRRGSSVDRESDETGSAAASDEEEEEHKCTDCHPSMHEGEESRLKRRQTSSDR